MIEETKYLERKNAERADAMREKEGSKAPRKEGKSAFDDLLEQGKLNQQSTLNSKTAAKSVTEQAVQELEKRQERHREQSKDQDKEDDPRHESRSDKNQTVHVGKKVIGKEGLKQNQGESGGRGFEGGGQGSKKENRFSVHSKKLTISEARGHASAEFGKEFQNQLAKSASHLPKTLPPEVLSQVVRHIRIGLNSEGHKEIELDLHKKVFKGLRLRLSTNHGKVKIHFLAADLEVRELFRREAAAIEKTLSEKGIAVEEIKVT